MHKTVGAVGLVGAVAAGAALLGLGVAGGWALGAAGRPASPGPAAQTYVTATSAGTGAGFRGRLISFDSCSGLLDAIHARARDAVGPNGFSQGGGYVYPAFGTATGTATAVPQAAVPSTSGSSSAAASGSGDSKALSHSTTNTQVKGVDEPDIVKTDGRYLISLDGQLLHIVDVRTGKLRSTIALPQPGSELLLVGDRVVVLTGETSGSVVYPMAETGVAMPYSPALYPRYAATGTTNATIVDISDPDAPTVVHRWSFSAGEVAARVVNGTIRLVLTSSPPQETWASPRDSSSTETARATKINQQIVDATPLDAWVPSWTGDDGQSHPLSACDAVATPAKPSSLSMVTVVSLDPGAASPGAGTSVLGAGDIAYAEGQHLFVSDSGTYPLSAGGLNPQMSNPTIHLLEFDISNPAQARYLASGAVPGQLHDSYALSEYQGDLRVTTTTTNPSGSTSTGIVELARQGDQLVEIGSVGGLGTGEQVYAVRYAGDRGYVVTFQQLDPLHVVDLSNPDKPVLRGTLTMTGYSSLLLPLDGDRLLGIGRAVQPEGGSGCAPSGPTLPCRTFVAPAGLQLSLFDVSDPAHPKLLDRQVLSDTYATAVADPHAVTLSPDGSLMVLPSTSGPLAVAIGAHTLTTTTGAFTRPYSVQDERTVIAGDRLFELADQGVAIRTLPGLKQTGWIAF